MSVVELRPSFPADDIASTLRLIADQVEAGEFGLITTCAVAMGHTATKPDGSGNIEQNCDYELFGCGPRCDIFTVRGLLLTVATKV